MVPAIPDCHAAADQDNLACGGMDLVERPWPCCWSCMLLGLLQEVAYQHASFCMLLQALDCLCLSCPVADWGVLWLQIHCGLCGSQCSWHSSSGTACLEPHPGPTEAVADAPAAAALPQALLVRDDPGMRHALVISKGWSVGQSLQPSLCPCGAHGPGALQTEQACKLLLSPCCPWCPGAACPMRGMGSSAVSSIHSRAGWQVPDAAMESVMVVEMGTHMLRSVPRDAPACAAAAPRP